MKLSMILIASLLFTCAVAKEGTQACPAPEDVCRGIATCTDGCPCPSCVEPVEPKDRPTLSEWKDKQAAKAAQKEADAKREAKMAAINKVVELLKTYRQQILDEGEKEVLTYNEFACFCNDKTREMNRNIQRGTDAAQNEATKLKELNANRDDLDQRIEELNADIKRTHDEMEAATQERKASNAKYLANEADTSKALNSLEAAMKVMKEGRESTKTTLVQLEEAKATIASAVELADALGYSGPSVQMQNYNFKSDSVIEMIEQLIEKFRDTKHDLDLAEAKEKVVYDAFIASKKNFLKVCEEELDLTQQHEAKTTDDIQIEFKNLRATNPQLLTAKEYLAELTAMCQAKAKTWDQRSKTRADELTALTSAIKIIDEETREHTHATMVRFAQQKATLSQAENVADNSNEMEDIEAAAEAMEGASLLQEMIQKVPSKGTAFLAAKARQEPSSNGRQAVIDMLKNQGKHLKSTALTLLADKISAIAAQDPEEEAWTPDGSHSSVPFAKVTTLIKELIDRLEKEASNEEGQKQWCDKATAEATDKRDRSSQRVSDLNAALEMLEARIAQLTDDIARLNSETAELEKSLAEATAQREQEAKENYEAIHEATAGYESVQWAKLTLHEFYIPANRAQVDAAGDDLVMNTTFDVTDKSAFKSKADFDAPDAGFENYESYQGKQGAATMLLGMMDVIISDFDRTITETRKTERQAAADYMKYKTETETTIASNNADVKAKTEQKGEDQDSERQTWRDIDSANAVLKGSVKELMDLRPVCVDTGMSFKERSDLRKNEITSLLKALCMMNAFQDGAGEDVEKFGKCDDISWGEGTQDAA